MTKRILLYLGIEALISTFFISDIKALYHFADHSPYSGLYSYIFVIPFISAFLFFLKREEIFEKITYSIKQALAPIIVGILLYLVGRDLVTELNQNDYLSIVSSSWLFLSIGFFIATFGWHAFKKASFPLLFLFFMVPIPSDILEKYIIFLQKGSEEVSYLLFQLLGVPVYRENNVFQLAHFNLEVARECSGIRSTIGLWITALLSVYILLRKTSSRLLALAVVIPISIIKNGIRIVTLGILASYVDPIYITNHWLHKSGGILFFSIALCLLFFPWIFFLRHREQKDNIHKAGSSGG